MTPARAPVPVIANRAAGGALARRLRTVVRPEEDEGPVRLVEVGPGEMMGAIRRAAEEGPGLVAVSGGDGTMHAAAQVLAGSGVALLPVPTGTLNHFARRHGIRGIDDARAALHEGRDRPVTLGVADDRLFLNTLVLGAYAQVVRRRERLRRVLPRWPAAVVAFGLTLIRSPRMDVRLEMRDGTLERRTAMVWVGLGRGSYPRSVGDGTAGGDGGGALEIAILRVSGRRAAARFLLRLAFQLATGRDPANDPDVEILHAPYVLIHRGRPLPATVDGERTTFATPLFVSMVAGALKVRVPGAQPRQDRAT